ncbi:hypothetical protein VI08_05130 [Luteibacter yeojuensis]|uniref:Beta-lactamase-related domain-containing protein n=1 Tax=Luteibacter yeojuensis TaxID=345309 RepID=A0A0F3KYY4_9GAMM|nr:hypothetical protein VI08_05130 [Luteibacter yeojuensis]
MTQGSAVTYEASRGFASVELGAALSPATQFRIGSITKTVTAAAILRLAADGRLDIDKPIATWLPTFPNATAITVRELLNHTSGVSDEWEAPLTDVLDTPARLALIGKAKPGFAPGTDWSYSNSGYMVLGAILEKITGKPWDEAERALVLQPLGIPTMGYHGDTAVIPGLAAGYTVGADGKLARPVLYSIAGPGAAGSLTADARAVALLPHQLATAAAPWPSVFKAMATPARVGDTMLPYGLGTVPGTLRGTPVVEHSGGIEGFTAHYVYIPGKDTSVAVLENSDAPAVPARALARRIAALAIGKPYPTFTPATWSSTALASVAGSYDIGDGSQHVITVQGGTLRIRRSGGPTKGLVTAQGDILYYAGDGTDFIHVARDANGAVVAIEFHADGAEASRREKRR